MVRLLSVNRCQFSSFLWHYRKCYDGPENTKVLSILAIQVAVVCLGRSQGRSVLFCVPDPHLDVRIID